MHQNPPRFFALIVSAILLISCSSQATVLSGPTVNPANGHQYFLLSNNTWTGSEAESVGLGGHLSTIRNQTENNWVYDTFHAALPNQAVVFWIGLNDAATEGTFVWSSGEANAYTHWGSGEPNNDPVHGGEDYVAIFYTYNSLVARDWNDTNNTGSDQTTYGIAEVVPEPVSVSGFFIFAGMFVRHRNCGAHMT